MSDRELEVHFEMLPVPELDALLRRFFDEVRSTSGWYYSRSTYSGLRASLNCHIRSHSYSRSISLTDKEFPRSSEVFKATLKRLSSEGLDTAKHHEAISDGDLEKLRISTAFNDRTPRALQMRVWFEIVLAFARRGCENIHTLKKVAYIFKNDDTGREYVEMRYCEKLKNHQGVEYTENRDSKPRMYGLRLESEKCPLAALKLYLSKLHTENDILFQISASAKKFDPSDDIGYSTRPV